MRPTQISKRYRFSGVPTAAGAQENVCLLQMEWAGFQLVNERVERTHDSVGSSRMKHGMHYSVK